MSGVSVIIPTRNRCALLPRAIESARRGGGQIEIIVVDDASDDQTPQICQKWDDVCYIRARRRLGVGGARNVGILASTLPYVSFLDDDDLRLPGSLARQVELLDAQPGAGMIYGRALYGDEECRPKGSSYPKECFEGDLFWLLLQSNFIPCPTVVFRRACLTRVGLLEEEAPGVEDWDLWVRIAESFPVVSTEEPVAIWRQSTSASGQFTSSPERMHYHSRRLHREKWLRLPRALHAGAARRRQSSSEFAERASQQLVWEAADRLKARSFPDFARVALAAIRMYPLNVSKTILRSPAWFSLIKRRREPGCVPKPGRVNQG